MVFLDKSVYLEYIRVLFTCLAIRPVLAIGSAG